MASRSEPKEEESGSWDHNDPDWVRVTGRRRDGDKQNLDALREAAIETNPALWNKPITNKNPDGTPDMTDAENRRRFNIYPSTTYDVENQAEPELFDAFMEWLNSGGK